MKKTSKNATGIFFLLLALICMLSSANLTVFAEGNKDELTPQKLEELKKKYNDDKDEIDDDAFDPDADPYETGVGVHSDPAVFEKDFILTTDQKIYTITEMEKVVSEIIKPEMSDLEKYYTLAIWVNKRVHYDWEFWSGRYNFEYYSHQWDSYGCMKEDEASVCAGIAVFYAAMCHAADLPCNFVRMQPSELDHTISYIPDINGNAYYLDVTEDMLFMSVEANPWGNIVDKEFSHVKKEADDNTFNFTEGKGSLGVSPIKAHYETSFEDWFKMYALHQNIDKEFDTEYVEKGSGESGKHMATYHDYVSNRTNKTDIWFLDDFYADPAAMKEKILAGVIDDSVICINGVDLSYDCDIDELKEKIGQDIDVQYFPSVEDGKIVAKPASLEKGKDYDVEFISYDEATKTATFSINGKGNYTGSYTVDILLKTAVVKKAPAHKTKLVYNGSEQELVEAGEALCGEMLYALGDEKEPTEEFSSKIPTATDAGEYYVWYKVVGDESCGSTEPELVKGKITIAPMSVDIIQEELELNVGETVKLNPVTANGMNATFTYNADDDLIEVDDEGNVKGIAAGTSHIYISGELDTEDPNYDTNIWLYLKVSVYDSLENARIKPGVYDKNSVGELVPEVVFNGETLKEGVDYKLEKVNEDDNFDKAGDYEVKLIGMGKFRGEVTKIFSIVVSEEEAEQALEEAKEELANAQDMISNLEDNASTEDIAAALKELVQAQKKLEEAEAIFERTRDALSKEKDAQIEDKIESLNRQIKKQAEDLERMIGDRLAELEFELQEQITELQNSVSEAEEKEKELQDQITEMKEREDDSAEVEKELKEQIEKLKQQIKEINDKFETSKIIDISLYPYEIKLEKDSYKYTGKPIEPAVKVPGLGADDYTVQYSNNTKIGTATITVIAKGNKFTGKIQTTFEITKLNNTLNIKGRKVTLKRKNKNQKLKASKVIRFKNKGQGTLTYAKVSGNSKITINKKNGKVTIKKGLKKGTYKVKVKVTAQGNDTYETSYKEVTFRVKIK